MSRGRRRIPWTLRGQFTDFADECPRCGRGFNAKSDMAKTSKGQWVHKTCMAGADDT